MELLLPHNQHFRLRRESTLRMPRNCLDSGGRLLRALNMSVPRKIAISTVEDATPAVFGLICGFGKVEQRGGLS